MPSSRKLAAELGVGRNTVFLVYQMLIAEGHLTSKERSGVFVADRKFINKNVRRGHVAGARAEKKRSNIHKNIKLNVPLSEAYRCPPDWQRFRYPFMEGRYDRSLFPVSEWREASRLALSVNEVEQWSTNNSDADDPALINEIRTKLLPRRGISAGMDEILITAGEQQALSLVAELFASRDTRIVFEEPGFSEMRALFHMRGSKTAYAPVDNDGMVVDAIENHCDLVYTTPSRQRPTGVTMSMERRKRLLEKAQRDDFFIIEDDCECELNYLHEALPALHSLDTNGRVIYAASLSKVLTPGVRLGFLVAPPDVVAAARQLRDITTRRPSPNNQCTAAIFLSLGHYDAMLNRLAAIVLPP